MKFLIEKGAAEEMLLKARNDSDVELRLTIKGSREAVNRVAALLSCIEYNGNVGHSGMFGISWDGDGADRIEISGIKPSKELKHGYEAMSGYGGLVEFIGEGGRCYVMRADNASSKLVYPAE
jgi:hypothetical protein